MNQRIFNGLFTSPYEHGRWLKDQQTLIDRMKKEEASDYVNEQIGKLESFQENSQCSIVWVEILQDRMKKYETEKISA
jgi:hypothetical protein